jgi:PAS domain S-box-containing protein
MSWSPEQHRLHGLDPAGGTPSFQEWLALVEPADRAYLLAAEAALLASEDESVPLEFHIRRRRDGARRLLSGAARVVADSTGRPSRIVGANIDITGRQHIEAELVRTTALLLAIGNCSPDLIYAKDPDGRYLMANPASLAVYGKTAAEVLGLTDLECHGNPEQAAALMANDRHVIETGRIEVIEEVFDTVCDGTRIFRSAKAPMRTAEGTLLGIVGVSSDITHDKDAEPPLRQGEELFRATFEQAAVGMAHSTLDGKWLRLNDRFCSLLGYDRAELLALTFREVTHPDDLEQTLAASRRLLDGEAASVAVEKRYIRKDGSQFWAQMTLSRVLGQDGEPKYFIAVVEDISQRKRTEEALRESERRFRMLFDCGPLPGYLIDPGDASIADCNEAAAAMLGYERDALRRMRIADIDPGRAGHQMEAAVPVLAGQSAQIETQHRTRSGEIRDVVIAAVPVDIGGRRLAHCTVVDITERKKAEARFRATFDQAAVGVAHIAPNGRFLRANQAICDGFGFSHDELARRSVQDLVAPDQRAEVMAGLRDVATGKAEAYTGDRCYLSADGRPIHVFVTVSMVHDRAEEPYFLVIAQDITERKAAEDALRRLTEDLEARVRDEVAAREAAQARAAQAERLQALGQLAGGIAHDFNNVLQAVQGSASMIGRKAADPESVRRYAQIVGQASERGASITRRLLSFARRGDLRAEAVEVSALLDGMREILSPTLGASIMVTTEAAPGLPMLLADKGQLETAMVNLAANARDAMPQGGTLNMRASAEVVAHGSSHPAHLAPGSYVRLAVTDTGSGMDGTTLSRVFQPFFTTKGTGSGTGLGLAMVKGFAEQSGGGVAIDSIPGQGTTVSLWLPQASSAAAPAPSPDAAVTGDAADAEVCALRVLAVDDDPLVLETVAAQLEDEGFAVTTAEGGVQALALLDGGLAVNVLVTDLSMPIMDGVSLIVEAQARCPTLPAVLLTGYAGDGVSLALGQRIRGPFALMRKPTHGSDLAAQISALVAEQEQHK